MKVTAAATYRCPYSGETLQLTTQKISANDANDIVAGELRSPGGASYPIEDGVAYLIDRSREHFSEDEVREVQYYQQASDSYDAVMDWLFASFYEHENTVRERMVDLLELSKGNRVLETGCGTCRDSIRIARRLGAGGTLFLQDLSPEMLVIGRERMSAADGVALPQCEFFVGNAVRLPFPNGYFDAAFHFGGFNLFSDKALALKEMARVVRVGGKVVVGDEALAPWLVGTSTGKILLNSNHLYRHATPIDCVPPNARDLCLRWIIGNAFYLIDFRVGEGEPPVDLDRPILGRRGGTHRTRYYGAVEGVTPEAKEMIAKAAAKTGLSLHAWLDRAVRQQFVAEQEG